MIHKYLLRDKNRKLTMARALDIFQGPYVTEKTSQMAQQQRIVVKVALDANKIEIKKAFEMVFEVPVESVNTLITKPRIRMVRGKPTMRTPIKKAIVQVKKGVDLTKMMGAA